MTNYKQERAQRIMNAFTADWQDEPIEQDKKCLANALRAILNEFEYCDDYGNAFVNADDLEKLIDELEAL